MTLERKAGICMSAAVGVAIAVGLYRDSAPSLGWQGAMLLSVLAAAVAAPIAAVLVQTIVKVASRGTSRRATDAADHGDTPSNETRRKPRQAIPWEAAALKP